MAGAVQSTRAPPSENTAFEVITEEGGPDELPVVNETRITYTPTPSAWTPESRRTGAIAIKHGMMTLQDDWGARYPVTVLEIPDNRVVQVKTEETDGYNALQIGCLTVKRLDKVTKAMKGHFEKAGVVPKRGLFEFRVTPDALLPVNTEISVRHFYPGQYVDITGTSKGKGFAGVMKRWHFGGLAASHGVSISHRSHGSTGNRQDPGRVFKGKKMAGHLGHARRTIQHLQVFRIDVTNNVLYVLGAVPGPKKGFIMVRDSLKKKQPLPPPFPTFVRPADETPATRPDEIWLPLGEDPLSITAMEERNAAQQNTLAKTAARAGK